MHTACGSYRGRPLSPSDIYIAGHWFVIVGQGATISRGTVFERNRLSYASGMFFYAGATRSLITNNLIFAIAPASQNW